MKKDWEKIARKQFLSLDADIRDEWSDLRDRISKRRP